MPMSSHHPARHGGVTSALLALVVIVLIAALALLLVPGLKDRLFGSKPVVPDSAPPAEAPATAPAPAARIGTITAVRASDGLPTFCLVATTTPAPALGATLRVVRNGTPHATLLLEAVADGALTCRVTGWSTGTRELAVGDSVEKP